MKPNPAENSEKNTAKNENKKKTNASPENKEYKRIGDNVSYRVSGKLLIVSIDTSLEGTASGTGKSEVIATTRGNKAIRLPDGTEARLGVNLFCEPR